MKFNELKQCSKEEREELFDHSLNDLRELLDMVADLYEQEHILVEYFRDGNDQYQSMFKDYTMDSPFKKGSPYIFVPLYAINQDDKPMCVTHETLIENLQFILVCVVEHIERKKHESASPLPKVRYGDKSKVDDEMYINENVMDHE